IQPLLVRVSPATPKMVLPRNSPWTPRGRSVRSQSVGLRDRSTRTCRFRWDLRVESERRPVVGQGSLSTLALCQADPLQPYGRYCERSRSGAGRGTTIAGGGGNGRLYGLARL